jgi:hypothetical protein
VQVTLIKSFHVKSGAATEVVSLAAGEAMPFCAVIARALTISVEISSETTQDLYVQLVAAPTTSIDCADVIPSPGTTPAGYTAMAIARFPAQTATPTLYFPNAARAMFTIVNQSAANLFVALAGVVGITPGSEFATIVLPPNSKAGYSVLNYRGAIAFRFDADDATGYALASEGSYT